MTEQFWLFFEIRCTPWTNSTPPIFHWAQAMPTKYSRI